MPTSSVTEVSTLSASPTKAPPRALAEVDTSHSQALAISRLSKCFNGAEQPVFEGINLNVPMGQSVALIGPNGAGKSTLLRCCMRLVEPDQGQIHLLGQDISRLKGAALRSARRQAAFVFQKHQLVPRLSVLSNVIHGQLAQRRGPRQWLQAFAPQETREKAIHCLEQVGLAALAEQRCDQLSGGQSQRVAIARALMQDPKIIMADEPTASLDPRSGREVMELFARLSDQLEMTLIFVSHDLEHAVDFSDRIVALKERGVFLDEPARQQQVSSLERLF